MPTPLFALIVLSGAALYFMTPEERTRLARRVVAALRTGAYAVTHPGQPGDPFTNLARVAKLWSVLLDREVTPIQVVQCMIALKQARLVNDPTAADSWVDIAGYAALSEAVLGKNR